MMLKLVDRVYPIIVAILWGTAGPLLKLTELNSFASLSGRAILPCLIAFLLSKNKIILFFFKRKEYRVFSFLSMLFLLFHTISFKGLPINVAVTFLYLFPLFTYLIQLITKDETLELKKIFFTITGFIGIVVICFDPSLIALSNYKLYSLSGLMMPLAFALKLIYLKKQKQFEHTSDAIYLFHILSALIYMPFLIKSIPSIVLTDIIYLLLIGLLVGFLSYCFFYYCLKIFKLVQLNAYLYLEIPFAFLFGAIFFQEKLNLNIYIGAGLISINSFLMMTVDHYDKKKKYLLTTNG